MEVLAECWCVWFRLLPYSMSPNPLLEAVSSVEVLAKYWCVSISCTPRPAVLPALMTSPNGYL